MDDRVRITIDVDQAEHDALRDIATQSEQSIDALAPEALRARIDRERDWEEAGREGLADIEAGRTVSHEEYLQHAAERRPRRLSARHAI